MCVTLLTASHHPSSTSPALTAAAEQSFGRKAGHVIPSGYLEVVVTKA
jgi:hypothetical protein